MMQSVLLQQINKKVSGVIKYQLCRRRPAHFLAHGLDICSMIRGIHRDIRQHAPRALPCQQGRHTLDDMLQMGSLLRDGRVARQEGAHCGRPQHPIYIDIISNSTIPPPGKGLLTPNPFLLRHKTPCAAVSKLDSLPCSSPLAHHVLLHM